MHHKCMYVIENDPKIHNIGYEIVDFRMIR